MTRSASGPLFIELWIFETIVPTTVNGTPSTNRVCPTAVVSGNSRRAIESPRNATRRRCSTSCALRKRPPDAGYMFRMTLKPGSTPSIIVVVWTSPAFSTVPHFP